ncbi:DegV family protein with EDD domain [Pullulanibacillus pueri]|uniref:DegV family protein n=1 Tax=Pullulanibacillus pueri TaxID=1437324 RepID=A0A8J2ZU18_9BACL|nr:DegV family protein [Pullulanibacillus pueri]MBM7684116.1 DegV family protein with EDD domain [Pullulanibacillus pueri]GGH76672.1 hypothetical protein GCM10007096_07450 [Pullulanibacillus pueri]
MSKIALACDSAADIPQELIDKYHIHLVSLSVIFGEEAYKEGVEIGIQDFYKKVRETENLPTTSQPAIGDFVTLYEKLRDEGYDDVMMITMSSGISGTNQTAHTAAGMVEGINIHIFDSEIASFPEGLYVIEAGQMISEGKSVDEILERLKAMSSRGLRAYFMVDDLNHLHRGGRLSGAQAFIGSLLKMKPILIFSDNSIIPIEKIRTKKKAIQRIKDIFVEDYNPEKPLRVTAISANRDEEAKELAEWVKQSFENVEVDTGFIGPTIGTHVGEGTLALVWYEK